MQITNILEQDYTTSKLDTGWRVQLSGTINPRKWRDVLSDGDRYWVDLQGERSYIPNNVLAQAQGQYRIRLSKIQLRAA